MCRSRSGRASGSGSPVGPVPASRRWRWRPPGSCHAWSTRPWRGRVIHDGLDLTKASAPEVIGRCGIVFASRGRSAVGLEDRRSARNSRSVWRTSASRARRWTIASTTTMDALGIRHLAERDPGTLSGGEQQRVAIASIAAMGPGVLVLDEPTAELDPGGTAAVVELLVRLQRRRHDDPVRRARSRRPGSERPAGDPRRRADRGRAAGRRRTGSPDVGRRFGAPGRHRVARPRHVPLPGRRRGAP